MLQSFLRFVRDKTWLIIFLCLVPVVIYALVFKSVALNVNYVAFDDIMILGVIPRFGDAGLAERWRLLTELFPEHRLVFSRSVILLLNALFGKVDLVWPMIVANICWALCALIFYRAFAKLKISLWYFVPVMWLWFNIQSFENIFWGVSSLCNFGVILFFLSALYFTAFHPRKIIFSVFFALAATFSYGNGLMVFPVMGLMYLLTGYRKEFLITLAVTIVVAIIYFIDFTPITQNLNFADPKQVKEGFFGLFGFIGSIATLSAYNIPTAMLYLASVTGMIFIAGFIFLYKNEFLKFWDSARLKALYDNKTALFAAGIAVFVGITALALTYKRIPTDTFEGMFKGRYRMYSTLWCVALYLAFLALAKTYTRLKAAPVILLITVGLNLVILHCNFADAVNNRRAAIAQEFNARYNADWLGIRMFSMDQKHFEHIRSYYQSADPLAEGWNPQLNLTSIPCDSLYKPDNIGKTGNNIVIEFQQEFFKAKRDFSDGAYVLLKSDKHTYASSQFQAAVPLKTTIRRQMYFSKGAFASFHEANVEPGIYQIYLLVRENGMNRIYCTGSTWVENQ
jgi:hypothetical protein